MQIFYFVREMRVLCGSFNGSICKIQFTVSKNNMCLEILENPTFVMSQSALIPLPG